MNTLMQDDAVATPAREREAHAPDARTHEADAGFALTPPAANLTMDLQDVQEVTNFFERRVSAYQVGVEGEVAFDAAF